MPGTISQISNGQVRQLVLSEEDLPYRSGIRLSRHMPAGAGSALILTAGSFEHAVDAIREARLHNKRNLLKAVCEGEVRGLSDLHAVYLKEMALEGIPSRQCDLPVRTEAKNHRSVHGYEEELLSKAWKVRKDAAYGAILFIDLDRDGIVQLLETAGVAESPLGRVPKQNPRPYISAEGRPINDMRVQNSKGSMYNHPPAPQPRHQAVARQSLWWHSRHPGVPQRCAKRDVPRAFKWHFLRTKDVAEFAVSWRDHG